MVGWEKAWKQGGVPDSESRETRRRKGIVTKKVLLEVIGSGYRAHPGGKLDKVGGKDEKKLDSKILVRDERR
ncbi:MAG: hypothetical protein ACFCU4_03860 [Puniceicoccaceae bacterium]